MSLIILAAVVVAVGFGANAFLNSLRTASYERYKNQRSIYGKTDIQEAPPPSKVVYPRNIGFAIGGLILFTSTFTIVPAGHVGVIVVLGKVTKDWTLPEGFHVVNPLADVVKMSVQIQMDSGDYDAASSDMQTVHTKFAMNFRLLPDRAAEVYQRVGRGYTQNIIYPAAHESLKAVLAQHRAADILHVRGTIKSDVQSKLAVWLQKYGVELKECSIANIAFDKEYEQAIRNKQVQEQQAEQKKYEVLKAQRQAEITAATALGDANAAREKAKGAADALRVQGDAESEYNKKVSDSLSAILVQQQYLTKWDGKLPQYMLGEGGSTLLQLPGAAK